MLRKSFRIGLKVGLLLGIGLAVAKMVQARRPAPEPVTPRDPWPRLPDAGPPVAAAPPTPSARPATPAAPVKKATKAAKKTRKQTRKRAKNASPKPWIEPDDAGVCPTSHPVKAKLSSKIFHLPGMLNYERTNPDRCYADPAAAEQDGLRAAKR